MLIAVEGIDGAGKTTVIDDLAARLEAGGRRILRLRRFMVPEITELWWRLVDADRVSQRDTATLAAADYRLGLSRCIDPALEEGTIVLVDKYVYSHLVFFAVRGLSLDRLRALFADVLVPDRVLYLSLPVPAALERLRAADGKPDLLEAGLDYRLGLSIGESFRRYGLNGAPAELRAEHFVPHQTEMEALFPDVLPASTHVIDAGRGREEVAGACLEAIRA